MFTERGKRPGIFPLQRWGGDCFILGSEERTFLHSEKEGGGGKGEEIMDEHPGKGRIPFILTVGRTKGGDGFFAGDGG